MKIDIEDLKKVKIDKNDVLIVKYKHDSTYPLDMQIKLMREAFPDNKIITVDINNADLIVAQMQRDFDEMKTL